MERRIIIVSDLHLGGEPPSDSHAGFQMCTKRGRASLAGLIRWIQDQRSPDRDVLLVLAGDVVDFLAEQPFAAFTADDDLAADKLRQAMFHSDEVWTALRLYLEAGGALSILLGNHDPELSLPSPRRLLLDRLGQGRIEFIDDNRALTIGPVLIEHGNRYDSWNRVHHDDLRQVRSALSRREQPPPFSPVPGSVLVTDVMNPLKPHYPFIDLLKPENEAVLPLLAVLEPKTIKSLGLLWKVLQEHRRRGKGHPDGQPVDRGYISASGEQDARTDQAMFDMARELAGAADPGSIGFSDLWDPLKVYLDAQHIANATSRAQALTRLHRALRARAKVLHSTFSVTQEQQEYLDAAKALTRRGFRVVVMGHTHLVKRVPLEAGAVYLNTGTWADLMCFPDELFLQDHPDAAAELERFATDLALGKSDAWRRHVPSFAQIDMGSGDALTADVYLFRGPAAIERAPAVSLREMWT